MKTNFQRIASALFLITMGIGAATAQQPETPEQFTERYLAATKSKDWATLAQLTHPEARQQLKKMFGEFLDSDKTMTVAKTLFNVENRQDFDALPTEAVFERLMQNLSKNQPLIGEALSNSRSTVIGHVKEGPDRAYVVYRTETNVSGTLVSQLGVIPLKKDIDSWRALLTGNMANMGQLLKKSQEPAPKPPTTKRRKSRKT